MLLIPGASVLEPANRHVKHDQKSVTSKVAAATRRVGRLQCSTKVCRRAAAATRSWPIRSTDSRLLRGLRPPGGSGRGAK